MNRTGLFACLLCLVVCLPAAGCSPEKDAASGSAPPPLVEVMTVEARNVPMTDAFVGQTAGSRAVELRAQVSGILMSRNYEEGGYVEKGRLLFEIEPDTYRAALEKAQGVQAQAQARYIQARQDLDRILPLYAKNAVSRRDRDSAQAAFNAAKADLDSAKAAVEEARIRLDHAYVRAPVSGYAGKENRTVGNLITAGSGADSLLTVVNQVDPIYADFAIPSPRYMRLRTLAAQGRLRMADLRASITLADNSEYPVKGYITFVDKAVNPDTSVVSARAEFENKDLFVLPGQFVRVTIGGITLSDAILVPQKAVLQTRKGTMVIVVGDDNVAEIRPVVLSDNMGNDYLVERGLKPGERIVVEGTNKAVPGSPVRIAAPEAGHDATTAPADDPKDN